MKLATRFAVLAAMGTALALLHACGGDVGAEVTGRSTSRVFNGSLIPDSERPWVVRYYISDNVHEHSAACTATLVGQQQVLTAAHCACFPGQDYVMLGSKQSQTDEDLAGHRNDADRYYVTSKVFHPDSNAAACPEGVVEPSFDFAVLTLERPVPTSLARGIDPATQIMLYPPPLCAPSLRGSPVSFIGVGFATSPGDDSELGIRRRGSGIITGIFSGGTPPFTLGAGLAIDMALAGSNTTGLQEGDSGGPLLRNVSGTDVVMGVANSFDGDSVWAATYSIGGARFLAAMFDIPYTGSTADDDNDGITDGHDNCRAGSSSRPVNPDQSDTDNDCVGDACDACPGDKSPSQDDCNAEAAAQNINGDGEQHGDVCDPTPCPLATARVEPLAAGTFGSAACQPSTLTGLLNTCPVNVTTAIRWHGVVDEANSGKTGDTQFAHCPCSKPHGTVEERLANCQRDQQGLRCYAGERGIFPSIGGARLVSAWRSISTTFRLPFTIGDVSARNHAYASTYALTGAPELTASWRFDRDLVDQFGFQPSDLPANGVDSAGQLAHVASLLDGIGWAVTTSFNGVASTEDDLVTRSHFFPQDLNPTSNAPVNLHLPGLGPWTGCALPNPTPPYCGRWIVAPDIGKVLVINNGRFTNPNVTATIAGLIYLINRTVTLVLPAESSTVLRTHGLTASGTGVTTSTGGPAFNLSLNGSTPSATIFPATSGVAASDRVYSESGLQHELYTLYRQAPGAPEQLSVFNLDSGTTQVRALSGASNAGKPVAVTYRQIDDSLYAIDDVTDIFGIHSLRFLRVSRLGAAVELARVPFLGVRPRVFLTATYDDQLLLSASAPTPTALPFYLLLRPSSSGLLATGFFLDAAPGALALAPQTLDPSTYDIAKQLPLATDIDLSELPLSSFVSLVPPKLPKDALPAPL